MDISDMHVWFRQYAQQMGMQNVRAILPEQIDILINTSILDKVNSIVKQHSFYSDNKSADNTFKLGQINALKPLYKRIEKDVLDLDITEKGIIPISELVESYLYIVSVALNYVNTNTEEDTEYFSVNIVDDVYIYDTLNDDILKPTIKTPIGSITNDNLNIYLEKYNNLKVKKISLSYIKEPIKVNYSENISSDLPSYLHIDILKHAADLYNISVRGGMYSSNREIPSRDVNTDTANTQS